MTQQPLTPPDREGRNRTCETPDSKSGGSANVAYFPTKLGCRGWSRTNISVIQSHSDFPDRPLGNEWLPQ
jgi:hypothetical protein